MDLIKKEGRETRFDLSQLHCGVLAVKPRALDLNQGIGACRVLD